MNIYKIFMILAFVAVFCSCDKEDDIVAELDPPRFDVQDSDDPTEHYIYEFYKKYKSFILFKYEDVDFKWNLTNNSDYVVTLPKPELKSAGLEYAKKVFLDVYSDDFILKYFPYKIMFAEKITNYDYTTGEDLELMAAYGISCVVISGVKDGVADMTEEELIAAKGQVNAGFWAGYMMSNNLISIPSDFYKVSDGFYNCPTVAAEGYPYHMDAKKETYGFVYASISPWNGYEYLPNQEKDLLSYFDYMFSHTSEDINQLCAEYPRIKQKFDLLYKEIKNTFGLDFRTIND